MAQTARKTSAAKKPEAERVDGAFSGNLTDDPELRFTASARAVVNFSVAVNERAQNPKTGEWEDLEPEFHRVTAWGYLAEHITESLSKGNRVVCIGYWQEREWEDKEGETRVSNDFTAREVGASMLFTDLRIVKASRSK